MPSMQAGKASEARSSENYAECNGCDCGYQDCRAFTENRENLQNLCEVLWRSVTVSMWSSLSRAALAGKDAIREYLMGTAYAEGAQALARVSVRI